MFERAIPSIINKRQSGRFTLDDLPEMPVNPKGMKGLAELLKYLLIVQHKTGGVIKGGKGNKITNLLRAGIKTKMDDYKEIKELI